MKRVTFPTILIWRVHRHLGALSPWECVDVCDTHVFIWACLHVFARVSVCATVCFSVWLGLCRCVGVLHDKYPRVLCT